MIQPLSELYDVFSRTKAGIRAFMDMLAPVISDAEDEYQRLYFHHIYEEEEQRLERLEGLLPSLSSFLSDGQTANIENPKFNRLLQDIHLEKFGLHNFLEHLDLTMYHFKDPERSQMLASMSEQTKADYMVVKDILSRMNKDSSSSVSPEPRKESDYHVVATAAHEEVDGIGAPPHIPASNMLSTPPTPTRKGLSVGSLKHTR